MSCDFYCIIIREFKKKLIKKYTKKDNICKPLLRLSYDNIGSNNNWEEVIVLHACPESTDVEYVLLTI